MKSNNTGGSAFQERTRRWANKMLACIMSVVLVFSLTPGPAFGETAPSLRAYPKDGSLSGEVQGDAAESYGASSADDAFDAEPGDGVAQVADDAENQLEGVEELSVVFDSQANDAYVGIGGEANENPDEIADVMGDDWEVATDGEEVATLNAAAFNPAEYGNSQSRSDAATAFQTALIARKASFLVAVVDDPDVQGSLARDLVEATYAEPAAKGDAGDYLYWHLREWKSSTVYAVGGSIYYIRYSLSYNSSAAEEEWVSENIDSVLEGEDGVGLANDMEVAEKVAAIHDWVARYVQYDDEHEPDSPDRTQYSAYGALHDRKAVCQGYAALFYRLCRAANIPCRIISGTGITATDSDAHGWNIVEVDGAWYCVDCTWDSNLSYGKKNVRHDYLLKAGEDFPGHVADERFTTEDFASAHPMAASSYALAADAPAVRVSASEIDAYGDTASFKAEVEGFAPDATLSYHWQWKDGAAEWADVAATTEGARSQELKVACTSATAARLFRCQVTASDGTDATSDAEGFAWKALAVSVNPGVDPIEGIGNHATFTATVPVEATSYCWQEWRQSKEGGAWEDIPESTEGSRSSELKLVCTTENAFSSFRCRVSSTDGRVGYSDPTGFHFGLYARATTAPVVGYADTGSFYADVRGDDVAVSGNVAYRWQYSADGDTWVDCPDDMEGSTAAELLAPYDASTSVRQYRCMLSAGESGRTFTTNAIGFNLEEGLQVAVTTQPIAGFGRPAYFTVTTNADSVPGAIADRDWQWSINGALWSSVPASFEGQGTANLKVPGSWVRQGFYYRCVVTAADGRTQESVESAFKFEGIDATASMSEVQAFGDVATATAVTSLDSSELPLRYRWQYTPDDASWIDCTRSSFEGSNARSMKVEFSDTTKDCKFRCVVIAADGRSVTTDEVGFSLPEIEATATASAADINEDSTLKCSVAGVPEDMVSSYQWQSRDPSNGKWENLEADEGDPEETLPTKAITTLTVEHENYYYVALRCRVTAKDGRVGYTNDVYIPSREYDRLQIDASLETDEVELGDTAVLKCVFDYGGSETLNARLSQEVKAHTESVEYQFQESNDGGLTWTNCSNNGANTDAMKVEADQSSLNMDYRCVVTDSSENKTVSNPIKVKVSGIVAQASTSKVALGQQATFTCNVTGGEDATLTYQWQRSQDALDWEDIQGATALTYKVNATLDAMSYQYRCLVSVDDEEAASTEALALSVKNEAPTVSYRSHVRDVGWQPYVSNGVTAGTTGRSLRMEALQMKLVNADGSAIDGGISYRAHVRDVGWQKYVGSNVIAGTTGRNLRMEAFEVKLEGDYAKLYDVYYRAHVGDIGWLGWAKNGETAGSVGFSARIEAVQVRLVPKGESFDAGGPHEIGSAKLTYQAHVADIGWQPQVAAGDSAGTTGRSLRMEALRTNLSWSVGTGNNIFVRSHLSDVGWQSFYAGSGSISGTVGQSRAMECVVIMLGGSIAKFYDVFYRVHVQDIGWMGWAKNNEWAGTTGGAKQIEAIQIQLVKKNESSSFSRGGAAYKRLSVSPASTSSGSWVWPTYNHNGTTYAGHGALDFPVPKNTAVVATCDGTVESVKSLTTSYGKHIKIKAVVDGATVHIRYCHLNSYVVTAGQHIKAGQIIGYSGSTGHSTGPHLHYEVRRADDNYTNGRLNPYDYLPGSSRKYAVS